jgi:signal transduction histidine kinase
MTSSDERRSKKASRDKAGKLASDSRGWRDPYVAVHAATKTARAKSESASAQTRAAGERLMRQMREANERLVIAAVRAQNVSDQARAETAKAKSELDDLMRQMRDANDRLAAAAAQAKIMEQEATQHEEEYRYLFGRLLQLQDEERRRVAVELHDSTAQHLAALSMNLDLVQRGEKALDARSRQALAESRSLAEQCAREVRAFAYLSHPPLLDEVGVVTAVRWYVEGFTKRSGIHVVMDLNEVGRLPVPIETALFRIVQESLTNVQRHSSSATASIRLTTTANAVALEIQDRGRGLPKHLLLQNGQRVAGTLGVGIQGMRERIRQLSGTFAIEFTEKGTIVRVWVPLNKDSS